MVSNISAHLSTIQTLTFQDEAFQLLLDIGKFVHVCNCSQ